MKKAALLLFLAVPILQASAQLAPADRQVLDSVSGRVIHYLQQKQADSIYSLAGENFRKQLSAADFRNILEGQVYPLNDFGKVSFVKNIQSVNKYRVEGSPELQLLIGLDADHRLETFLIQPYQDD